MQRFSNILFVFDPDVDNSTAFKQALQLSKNNQAKITVVGVIDTSSKDKLLNIIVEQRKEQLNKLLQDTGIAKKEIEVKVLAGKISIELIREVLRYDRDLIIKSLEHEKSLSKQLLGSVDMQLLRKCPCPVWLIKPTQQKGYREILVGVDHEPNNAENDALNKQLLEIATAQALADFSELHIIHAWQLEHESYLRSAWLNNSDAEVDAMLLKEERLRKHWLETLVDKYNISLKTENIDYLQPQLHLIKGSAKDVIPEYAEKIGAELVVLGTVGRTGIPGFIIGNTSESILNQINCSILAIKPQQFISPVTL